MKNLIIYTHFDKKSFTNAVCTEIISVLKNRKQEVKIIDLYADNYNPVLQSSDLKFGHTGENAPKDTIHYQEMIKWADHLIFVFPLWWYQMPAILKGFIDRTFIDNFAFKYDENGKTALLSDKKTTILINAGSNEKTLEEKGHDISINKTVDGIFSFCGMNTEITIFKNVLAATQEVRENYIKEINTII